MKIFIDVQIVANVIVGSNTNNYKFLREVK